MTERTDIAPGTFVFTSDTRELGVVALVQDDEVHVNLGDHRGSLALPSAVVDHMSSGRLLLTIDAAEVRRRYAESTPGVAEVLPEDEPVPAASDHVPEEALRLLWDQLEERSWSGLHWLAHHEETQHGSDRIDRSALHDIVKVARHLEDANEQFPERFEAFRDVVNRHAETMAHETLDNA